MSRNSSGLTAAEKFCLDAYSLNRNTDLAYILSRPTPPSTTKPDILHRMALRWLRSDAVKLYLQQRAAANNVANMGDETDGANNRSNEDIIKDLNGLLDRTDDFKLKAQMLVQLAQLKGMTRRPSQEEKANDHINYFLPIRCESECPLYIGYGRYLKENGLKPTTDEQASMIDAYSAFLHRKALEGVEKPTEIV